MPLDLGIKLGQEGVEIVGVPGLSSSPAASRASAGDSKRGSLLVQLLAQVPDDVLVKQRPP
jgi:hypothetical protein